LSIYRWGENESLQCSTLRGFIINDYYLRRKLLNKYKVPYWVIDKYLSFLISNYENWCKSINKEFSFDLNDLNLKKQNEYIILIYRLLIKIYLGALLFYKRITS